MSEEQTYKGILGYWDDGQLAKGLAAFRDVERDSGATLGERQLLRRGWCICIMCRASAPVRLWYPTVEALDQLAAHACEGSVVATIRVEGVLETEIVQASGQRFSKDGIGHRLTLAGAAPPAEALALWEAIAADHPDDPRALHGLGEAWADAGEADRALAALDRALSLGEDDGARSTRAKLLAAAGRLPEAIDDLDRLLDWPAPWAGHFEHRATLRARLGDDIGACRDYEALFDRWDTEPVAAVGYGRACEAVGDMSRAKESFDLAVELERKRSERRPSIWHARAKFRVTAGDKTGAKRDLRQVISLSEPDDDIAIEAIALMESMS